MSTFLYTRPTERLGGTVAVQSGTAPEGYPPENLDDGLPSKPAKLAETTGAWTRDLITATRVDFCAVIHHNLTAGLNVRLQGNATDVWTAPTVDVPFTITTPHIDLFTKNLWVDLTQAVPVLANRTMRWWRLVVVAANAAPIIVGEWAMYTTVRNFGIRNISKGSKRTTWRPSVTHETDLLVRRSFDLGTTIRAVTVELEATTSTQTDVEAWRRSAGGEVVPFVIVPHREEDEAWFVTFLEPEFSWTREHRNYNPMTLQFQEVTRGLWV